MIVKLRTVPHTGTTFMEELFKKHNVKYHKKHFAYNHIPDKPGDITVSTIRDPLQTYESTVSRGRYDEKYHRAYQELNQEWENNPGLFVIPIDKPDERDECLAKLSDQLGIDLKTDWTPVSTRRHKNNIKQIDLTTEYNLPIVKAFYGKSEETKPVEEPPKVVPITTKKKPGRKKSVGVASKSNANSKSTPIKSSSESSEASD